MSGGGAGIGGGGGSAGAGGSGGAPVTPGSLLDSSVTQLSGRNSTLVYSSSIAAAAANATGDAPPAGAPPPPPRVDPPLFAYPPVGDLPTVYFTASMKDLDSPDEFTAAMQAAYIQAVSAFLGASPLGGPVAAASVLAVPRRTACGWSRRLRCCRTRTRA
jgi:hypothetical protein